MSSIPKVHSVKELVHHLDQGVGYAGWVGLMRALKIGQEEVRPYLTWNDERYTRNRLAYDDTYELLAMAWEPVHDYRSREGWAYVVQGELTEERYYRSPGGSELTLISSGRITEGNFTYMTDLIGMHRFLNSSEGRTISLHLYSEPVSEWTAYDPEEGDRTVQVPYDSDHGINA
jgi:hypothetical protein